MPSQPAIARAAKREEHDAPAIGSLTLVAIGVVYGDIGTSPLYAFKECFSGAHGAPLTEANVLGALSLIFWALILVISIKYLLFILSVHNRGEGGILALVALLGPRAAKRGSLRYGLILLGVLGAALIYADSTITPAISVLSAVEGLKAASPVFAPYVVPLTILVLIILFALQPRGTLRLGGLFGPVMLVWFVVLGALGIGGIVQAPAVLAAADPAYGLVFLQQNGFKGFILLGTVFLVVTGGEALYADLGHVGPLPIRLAWFGLVLPALLLNYFGQGALVLSDPSAAAHPFFRLAPSWASYPLVALATAAAVIASQAVITGAFSLANQAVQLGYLPHLEIVHTAARHAGQIYVPLVNWLLMLMTLGLVLAFRGSEGLASAYGVTVSALMVITTILVAAVAVRWKWSLAFVLILAIPFLVIDLAFFSANLFKLDDGGWFPLLAAGGIFAIMWTWRDGKALVSARLEKMRLSRAELLETIAGRKLARAPGTSVFLTRAGGGTPAMLLHHIDLIGTLHERVLLVRVVCEDVPRVHAGERLEYEQLGAGFSKITARYGFMQRPDVPLALRQMTRFGVDIDPDQVTYYIGREAIISTDRPGLARWREVLFAFLAHNITRSGRYFDLPSERVIELGIEMEI